MVIQIKLFIIKMQVCLFTLSCMIIAVSANLTSMEVSEWKKYKLRFGKYYDNENTDASRHAAWKMHLKDITELNSNPFKKYKKGLNYFSETVRLSDRLGISYLILPLSPLDPDLK